MPYTFSMHERYDNARNELTSCICKRVLGYSCGSHSIPPIAITFSVNLISRACARA